MPCNSMNGVTTGDIALSSVDDLRRENRKMKVELDRVTSVLCKLLYELPPAVQDALGEEAQEWWQEHRAWDARNGR